MLAAFWEAVGGKLADRWAAVSIPALIFWLGGLAAWTYHRGGLHTLATPTWLKGQTSVVQVAVIVIAAARRRRVRDRRRTGRHAGPAAAGRLLAVLDQSAAPPARPTGSRTGPPPKPPPGSRPTLAYRQPLPPPGISPPITASNAVGAAGLPPPATSCLPRSGTSCAPPNAARLDKYGLDTITVWPHLWLLLPETTRTELRAARASLDTAVVAATWGILFCAFTPFTWLAIPIGLAVTTIAVTAVIPARAQVFGELIEAAYDLHRTAVYQQLRWPLPANPQQEHPAGAQLTSLPAARLR